VSIKHPFFANIRALLHGVNENSPYLCTVERQLDNIIKYYKRSRDGFKLKVRKGKKMKRTMILTAAVVLCMTAAMAKNADAKMGYNNVYDFNVNTYSLARTLNANPEQYAQLADINEMLHADMRRAGYARKTKRQERVNEAVKRNLSVMRNVLNDQQYRKYLMLLNATLTNRGLK
jgi:hypothetical protein